MRDYSKISPQFWTGATGRKIKALGNEAVIVGLYLLTSPHANMLGFFYLPKVFISHETGLSHKDALKGLQSVIEAEFCSYDDPSEMVFVYEMARYQVGEQLKPEDKRVIGIRKEYKNLPKCPFLYDFYKKYKGPFHLEEPRHFEGASEGHRSQEQEQKQEQENIPSKMELENSPPFPPEVTQQETATNPEAKIDSGQRVFITEDGIAIDVDTGEEILNEDSEVYSLDGVKSPF